MIQIFTSDKIQHFMQPLKFFYRKNITQYMIVTNNKGLDKSVIVNNNLVNISVNLHILRIISSLKLTFS